LHEFLNTAVVDPADKQAARGPESRPLILVVDDVADNRAMLVRRFEKRGFDVEQAAGGAQALRLITDKNYDAILLDVMMPDMDGLAVLAAIRVERSGRSLPVIMVTAKSENADIVAALELGANDYITKPVDFAVAFARVNGQVERKRAGEALEAANAELKEAYDQLKMEVEGRERLEAHAQYLAHHDALTGLGNRILLKDRLTQAISYAKRYDRWVTVALIGLDNFKIVNDSLGHEAGDDLLKLLAARMVKTVRGSDTVARLGGDEFVVVLLDQPKSAEVICATVEKMSAAITEPLCLDGHPLCITSSIGIATFPSDGADAETLLNNADAAMYRAKEIGRANVQFYQAEFNQKALETLLLQQQLRDAIARSEFVLLYQPQVDLRSDRIFAVEALIRWRHPTLGLLSPAQFIPLAEKTGLIAPIGDWVLREACRQNQAWQDRGLSPIAMCVNVSPRQFKERTLHASVIGALAQSGLGARYLELELTESLIMQDLDSAIATMNQLKSLGVQLSIDDFGTGYSSFAALKNFPIGRLKIDKSFIADLSRNENDRAVASAVISLGQKLNLRVIAEGVETDEQVAFLREADCDEMQGYHFSRPIPANEIAALLKKQDTAAASERTRNKPVALRGGLAK
jgi:diguanylate cyclase (GGDEF)-like protein